MAVYQGARRPAGFRLGPIAGLGLPFGGARDGARRTSTPRSTAAERPSARLGQRAARRVRSRPSAVGIALAAIVIVFSAAFMSLSQSVRVAAMGYDIVRLTAEHDRLDAIREDLHSNVQRLRGEPAIRKLALDAGLGQLGAPLIVPAR
jgi:cell division protein FtsB